MQKRKLSFCKLLLQSESTVQTFIMVINWHGHSLFHIGGSHGFGMVQGSNDRTLSFFQRPAGVEAVG